MDDKLITAGLWGRGLMQVNTPTRVARYNDALTALGVTPTSLTSFSIDGMGWSPEVAHEKGDFHYLLDKPNSAHQFAIIISPDQERKPNYVPYTSYERRLMREYFGKFKDEIAAITATHALVLDIDQEILRYKDPRDLLLVENVVVRSSAGTLLEGAAAQKRIIKRLLEEDDAWADSGCRNELIKNAVEFGDLRKRKLAIAEFEFDDIGSFYSEAFGGVFVFRRRRDRLLVLCDEKVQRELTAVPGTVVSFIGEAGLPSVLQQLGFVGIDLNNRERQAKVLEDLANCLMASYVFKVDPTCDWEKTTDMNRRRVMGRLPVADTELLREIELLRHTLSSARQTVPTVESLSRELQLLMLQPSPGLKAAQKEAVIMLLARLRSHDPLELYTADKNRFFLAYQGWPPGKQAWAIQRIAHNYKAVMDS